MLSQLALTNCQTNVGVVSARVKLIFPIREQMSTYVYVNSD